MTTIESATARALAVPELLEAILLCLEGNNIISTGEHIVNLPKLPLFPLRQISKSWNATINGSIHLQRLMCLSPNLAPCASIEELIDADAAPSIWLMLVVTPAEERLKAVAKAASSPVAQSVTSFNTVGRRDKGYNAVGLPIILHCQIGEHINHLKSLGESFHRREASWRLMRVSLSPQDDPHFRVRAPIFGTPPAIESLGQEWSLFKDLALDTKAGDTLGDLFDAYLELFEILGEMWRTTQDPGTTLKGQRDAVRRADLKITAKFQEYTQVPAVASSSSATTV